MDTAFFILSKLVGLALQVETWLAIGMALSLLGGFLARPLLARRSSGVTLTVLLLIGMLPIGEVLLRPLEAEFPPRVAPVQIDGIVVLGGVEDQRATAAWGQPQFNEAAERLTAAAALAIQHPNARLVFSGGSQTVLPKHLSVVHCQVVYGLCLVYQSPDSGFYRKALCPQNEAMTWQASAIVAPTKQLGNARSRLLGRGDRRGAGQAGSRGSQAPSACEERAAAATKRTPARPSDRPGRSGLEPPRRRAAKSV